jgi:hypothetical protein
MNLPALPATADYNLLPPGIHDSSLEGVEERFSAFQVSDRRCHLFAKLKEYVEEIRKAGWEATLIVDGSFVMAGIDEPDDIDLILVMPEGWDITADLRPFEYNLVSKKMVKRRYGFDLREVRANSPEMHEWLEFFSKVNVKWCGPLGIPAGTEKGLVRIYCHERRAEGN